MQYTTKKVGDSARLSLLVLLTIATLKLIRKSKNLWVDQFCSRHMNGTYDAILYVWSK